MFAMTVHVCVFYITPTSFIDEFLLTKVLFEIRVKWRLDGNDSNCNSIYPRNFNSDFLPIPNLIVIQRVFSEIENEDIQHKLHGLHIMAPF